MFLSLSAIALILMLIFAVTYSCCYCPDSQDLIYNEPSIMLPFILLGDFTCFIEDGETHFICYPSVIIIVLFLTSHSLWNVGLSKHISWNFRVFPNFPKWI